MFDYLKEQKNKWYGWFAGRAHGRHAQGWLATVAVAESIFFPVPTAAFYIPILMVGAKRWLYFATYTTIFSVIGGVIGYIIAALFFDTLGIRIIEFYHLSEQLSHVQKLYDDNAFFVTFVGAFTPIPYKVFVLAGGFLKVNFIQFLLASILGRGAQFFVIGYVMKLFGPTITKIFLKYFNIVILILIAALVFSLAF